MAVNLSKFYGVPTKRSDAIKQFKELKIKERNRPFNRGRYLVLQKRKYGSMDLYMNYVYESKPKMKKGMLVYRFPK